VERIRFWFSEHFEMLSLRSYISCLLSAALAFSFIARPALAIDLNNANVLRSIEAGKKFLTQNQNADGSWNARDKYRIGVTSLSVLALLNSGMKADAPPVKKGLDYLRSLRKEDLNQTYEISLAISALSMAKQGGSDGAIIRTLVRNLSEAQVLRGPRAGLWSYSTNNALIDTGGDPSNGQFAILGLRDAVHANVSVDPEIWRRAKKHWLDNQNADGGWSYSLGSQNQKSSGSMTVAGIATLIIASSMLAENDDLNPDGTPVCCTPLETDEALERGIKWLAQHFAVGHNPNNSHPQGWLFYYLYGLERAGRLSGLRFFGKHDWYREGASFLINRQSRRDGSWEGKGTNSVEGHPVVATSLSLLFLSKGLSPVLINKLKFGPTDPQNPTDVLSDNWNRHDHDVGNLTEFISSEPGWPKLLTWQTADLNLAAGAEGVRSLMQAPILYLSGDESPEISDEQVGLLKEFLNQGGFLFAVRNCSGNGFDEGFRELVERMYPEGEAKLKPLGATHPVYRSENLLDPETVDLWGVDVGCRTAIIYSPVDLSCLWDKWMHQDPPSRPIQLKSMITKAMNVGVNVIAYATGREPPKKLDREELVQEAGAQDKIERGLLQIAKLRHTGGWDAAPRALRNLLLALNRTAGLAASTKPKNLTAADPNIFNYPILYMHGREPFQLTRAERDRLKEHLSRGGVLFADACCGSRKFDSSFRSFVAQMYPKNPLKQIPAKHELFTSETGHDITQVRRRVPQANNTNAPLKSETQVGEPFLEGVEVDGRLAIIYSKYDISCALERQASSACIGYIPEDAERIAVNVILYALSE